MTVTVLSYRVALGAALVALIGGSGSADARSYGGFHANANANHNLPAGTCCYDGKSNSMLREQKRTDAWGTHDWLRVFHKSIEGTPRSAKLPHYARNGDGIFVLSPEPGAK